MGCSLGVVLGERRVFRGQKRKNGLGWMGRDGVGRFLLTTLMMMILLSMGIARVISYFLLPIYIFFSFLWVCGWLNGGSVPFLNLSSSSVLISLGSVC